MDQHCHLLNFAGKIGGAAARGSPKSVATAITLLANLLAAHGTMQSATGALIGVNAPVVDFMPEGGLSVGFAIARDLLRAPGLGTFRAVHGPSIGGNSRDILTRS